MPPRLADLFTHRAFVRFWFARLAGITANQMLMVAVAWHMYD
ncbi:MAG: MFS transporter, partial [Lysobacteraceae bacterium]